VRQLVKMHRSQQGITGLETAIILIAFVVVASVFAYTVLSAGLFSTQKSQQAVQAALQETLSTMELRGSVVAYKGDSFISSGVGKVEFTVTTSGRASQPINLTPPYAVAGGALVASGTQAALQVAYTDGNVTIPDVPWTVTWLGSHSGDNSLDDKEKAAITVWLHTYDGANWAAGSSPPFMGANVLGTDQRFTVEVKAANGAVLTMSRTTPSYLDQVMDLR